jgi:hypothetical protein
MLRLVKADLRFNAVRLMWAFAAITFGMFVRFYPGHFGSSVSIGFQFGLLMPVVVFIAGPYYKSDLLYRTMPINFLELISAKYLIVFLLLFGPIVEGIVFDLLGLLFTDHGSWVFQIDRGYTLGDYLIAGAAASCVAFSAILPVILRWGSLMRVIAMWVLLFVYVGVARTYFLTLSAVGSAFFGTFGWVLIVVLALLTIGVLSFRISLWLVRHKEY